MEGWKGGWRVRGQRWVDGCARVSGVCMRECAHDRVNIQHGTGEKKEEERTKNQKRKEKKKHHRGKNECYLRVFTCTYWQNAFTTDSSLTALEASAAMVASASAAADLLVHGWVVINNGQQKHVTG